MKVRTGGKDRVFDQLLSLSTTTRYNRDAVSKRWSDPQTSLLFRPSSTLSVRLSAVHTLYGSTYDSLAQTFHDQLRWTHPVLRTISLNTSIGFAGGGDQTAVVGNEGFVSQRQEPIGGNTTRGLERSRPTMRGMARFGAWQANLRHTYQWSRREPGYSRSPEPVNQAEISATLVPWRDWRVNATTTYDIQRNRRDGDALTIVRQLHCWEAELDWTIRGPFAGYYFRIYIIDIPDIKIESASETNRFRS
jgi:hypothetical protein